MSVLTFLEIRKFWTCRTFLQRFQTAPYLLTSERGHVPKFFVRLLKKTFKRFDDSTFGSSQSQKCPVSKTSKCVFGENPSSWNCTYERIYLKRGSSERPLKLIFLDLDVQMRWYLDWGTFRLWKTFFGILVNRCWLNIDIEASVGKKGLKMAKKATVF